MKYLSLLQVIDTTQENFDDMIIKQFCLLYSELNIWPPEVCVGVCDGWLLVAFEINSPRTITPLHVIINITDNSTIP